MLYRFELTSDDYIAMSLSANKTASVVRGYMWHALAPAAALWIVVHDVAGIPVLLSAVLAIALFLGILAYHALTWRRNFVTALRGFYEGPTRPILGPHTLELKDDGLHSSGPLHRTFRAWPCVTSAVVSGAYVFFHTMFGVVYVLPRRAVEDAEGMFAELKARNIEVVDAVRLDG